MNPETIYYSVWAILCVFAFAGFLIFAQQGKAYGQNTWLFKNKVWLGLICVAAVLASLAWLHFH